MENLLKKEKMLYDALASKTRDKDYMISFHDYFSFILNECVSICNHLAEPMVERGKDIEILESLYAEIIQGVTKSIVDIEELSKKNNLENDIVLKDEVQDIHSLLNGTTHVFDGEVLDSIYSNMFDIVRRLHELGFEKELSNFVRLKDDGTLAIEDIIALQKRKDFLNKRNNFFKKDARTIAGSLVRLKDLYIAINEAEQYVPTKNTPKNFFDNLQDQAKSKEYTYLMNGSTAEGTYFKKDKHQNDIDRFHQSIVIANPIVDDSPVSPTIFFMKGDDIYHYKNDKLIYTKRGTKDPKYVSIFKNIVRYMPPNTSDIGIGGFEKLVPDSKKVGNGYRNNLMKKGALDKLLADNNIKNIHPETGEKILHVTDDYIYFNNKL